MSLDCSGFGPKCIVFFCILLPLVYVNLPESMLSFVYVKLPDLKLVKQKTVLVPPSEHYLKAINCENKSKEVVQPKTANVNLEAFDLNWATKPRINDLDFAYIAPGEKSAFSFSSCSKCGSTSLFKSLYRAVYGKEQVGGPPWVQEWMKWPKLGRPKGSRLVYAGHLVNMPNINWIHYQIIRDPVDRYISSYFSKIRCCGAELPGISPEPEERKVCARDKNDSPRITRSLLKNSHSHYPKGYSRKSACFYFEEYVHLLVSAPENEKLDDHLKRQRSVRSDYNQSRLVWMGEINNLQHVINGFIHSWPESVGLPALAIGKKHTTWRGKWQPSPKGITDLCRHSLLEYKYLKMKPNSLCAGVNMTLI